MIPTTWTEARTGESAAGLGRRPRALRRASEAFTAPCQGLGLPSGASVFGAVVDPVVRAAAPLVTDCGTAVANLHIDPTPLGSRSSGRSPG